MLVQTLNPYAYGVNNPLVYVDANGRFIPILMGAAIGAVIGAVIGGGAYYLTHRKGTFNWGDFALWTAGGAAIGAVGGALIGGAWMFLAPAEELAVGELATEELATEEVAEENLATESSPQRLWQKTEVNGKTVYQRSDLIDPNRVDANGFTNLERMQEGKSPIGPDGRPINLHHMLQTDDGPLAELTETFHRTNSRVIHINPSTVPSGIDRAAFGSWREAYWMIRALDFLPK